MFMMMMMMMKSKVQKAIRQLLGQIDKKEVQHIANA